MASRCTIFARILTVLLRTLFCGYCVLFTIYDHSRLFSASERCVQSADWRLNDTSCRHFIATNSVARCRYSIFWRHSTQPVPGYDNNDEQSCVVVNINAMEAQLSADCDSGLQGDVPLIVRTYVVKDQCSKWRNFLGNWNSFCLKLLVAATTSVCQCPRKITWKTYEHSL